MEQEKMETETVDAEWVELMQIAKDLGLSIEEIKAYLTAHQTFHPA
ncbi:anti-repressor SinI family protein [Domibacillus robiginosus]|nr:anti-repressor SinI family protein [Domibacillus robiginosus]